MNYSVGTNTHREENVTLGHGFERWKKPARIGDYGTIRSGTIIYADTVFGDYLQTGHNVMIREAVRAGAHVTIGTGSVLDGTIEIGDFVSIQSQVYIPTHTKIGSYVFIGPGVTMTNDMYPLKMRDDYIPKGPVIEDGVTIGGGAVLCPEITIGQGSFIAAGAVVTKDVPPYSLVKGNPGIISALPENLKEQNMAKSWRRHHDQAGEDAA